MALPLLMLPDFTLSVLSSDGATATGSLSPRWRFPDASDHGCLIFRNGERFFFVNPLSRSRTTSAVSPLPDLYGHHRRLSLPVHAAANAGLNDYTPSPPCKIVMSAPINSGSCMMAGISGFGSASKFEPRVFGSPVTSYATLYLCRPGSATWSVTTNRILAANSDIVFYNGKLYLFNKKPSCHLYAFDLGEDGDGLLVVTHAEKLPAPPPPLLLSSSSPRSMCATFYYLVESRGRLLLVARGFSECKTRSVAVFALNLSTSPHGWASMESLYGEVIFLSSNSALSLPASRYGGVRGDRIYFSQGRYLQDDTGEECSRRKNCRHMHCEVFDMKQRTAETPCWGIA